MLRLRDPRVVPAAAHSRRHASVKEWVDRIASLFELEAFPIGWCLLDHLASRDDKTLGLFAMRFFGNPPDDSGTISVRDDLDGGVPGHDQ